MIDSTEFIDRARAIGADIVRERPFEALRARPGFTSVIQDVTTLWGSHPGDQHPDEKPLADVAQFAGAIFIASLEATPGGLTLQRLDQALREHGIGGVGRARAVLTYLSYIRYIEAAPREGDGRFRHYRVTPTARGVVIHRLQRELRARRSLEPDALELAERIGETAVFDAFVVAMSEASPPQLKAHALNPNPVSLFGDRSRGLVLMCHLLASGEPGDSYPPRGPLAYSVSDLAKRCRASRMQVSLLLGAARQEDLLTVRPDGREALSEKMIIGVEMLVAATTRTVISAARLALEHGAPRTA